MEHELNTALTVLKLRVQMLRRRATTDEQIAARLGEIAASVDEVRRASARLLARMGHDAPEVRAPAQSAGPSIADPVAKPHVAVINDDTTFLRLMDELLGHEEGYRVSTSFVGGEAHSFVREVQPDLVVLDLVFGDSAEQGWRTLDLLTLDPATTRIPVIVCSAATTLLHQHADWLRRFDVEVLPKPFDVDDLLSRIADCLGATDAGTCDANRQAPHIVLDRGPYSGTDGPPGKDGLAGPSSPHGTTSARALVARGET